MPRSNTNEIQTTTTMDSVIGMDVVAAFIAGARVRASASCEGFQGRETAGGSKLGGAFNATLRV